MGPVHRKDGLDLTGSFHVSRRAIERLEEIAKTYLDNKDYNIIVRLNDAKETTCSSLVDIENHDGLSGADIARISLTGMQYKNGERRMFSASFSCTTSASYALLQMEGPVSEVNAIIASVSAIYRDSKTFYSALYRYHAEITSLISGLFIGTILLTIFNSSFKSEFTSNIFVYFVASVLVSFVFATAIMKIVRFLFPMLTFDFGRASSLYKDRADLRKWIFRAGFLAAVGSVIKYLWK